ncbi:unnamed protein product [Rodentolepis nana]|uniref:Small ribosomal subunit protein mS23 n=1 Tax=Rodentolepis nana TaxID=102285 RepID=A0A0R3TMY3_RODNA|nr:unnamed protein product [Rodentolepis nana]
MSSYGSRAHKVSSIYRRVNGLLKNGALSANEKPLWFDVYKAFPPKIEPTFERPLPTDLQVREILYPEDVGRAKFFRTFENSSEDLHNLFSQQDNGTHLSKFIAKGRSMGADENMELWEDDHAFSGDLIFLGTGSAYPSPHRGASASVLRHSNGTQWLFDCGEGTQIQIQRCAAVRAQKITRIFISHLHGDHIFGLPGMLATISGMREHVTDPMVVHSIEPDKNPGPPDLEIYGPAGLRRFLRSSISLSWSLLHLTYVVHELHPRPDMIANCYPYWTKIDLDPVRDKRLYFELEGRDIFPDEHGFFRDIFDKANGVKDDRSNFVAHAFMLEHPVPCVGYLFLEPSPLPALHADKAIALGVKPGPLMGKLKAGQSVTFERDGKQVTVSPSQVLGPQKRGRRIAILGDSRNSSELRRLLQLLCYESRIGKIDQRGEHFKANATWRLDCLVHEATGHSGEQGDQSMADKGHSTARSAAAFASTIGTRQLVLNHFSQRFINDEAFLSQGKDPVNYSRVSSLLEDAKSCKEFDGEVHLSDDLKIIPIVGNVEDGDDLELDTKLQAQ